MRTKLSNFKIMKKTCRLFFVLSVLFVSAFSLNVNASQRYSLNGEWTLSFWPQPIVPVRTPEALQQTEKQEIKARVPGNVELDLLQAGLISDPMKGNNVNALRRWEGHQWAYSRSFEAPGLKKDQRLQLWFGGIDCLADIFVNGQKVGSPENMFIEHAYDITDKVHQGAQNKIEVILRSAVLESQKHLTATYSVSNAERYYLRKAPHMFGWDIMPRLVSAGLWRGVELRVLDPIRITDVNINTMKVDTAARTAEISVHVQTILPINRYDNLKARFTLKRHGKTVAERTIPVVSHAFDIYAGVKNAEFWWPHGYGDAALYDASLELTDSTGTIYDRDVKKIGLRTIQLIRDDINTKNHPGQFLFKVNGEPIFVRGTNWVPQDALHSRDPQHTDTLLAMAADLNLNMIRCWGGNVYEDHHFFDLCDSLGIMVWQDFAMACTMPPQRDDFCKALEEEVTSVVLKLRNHASLALWSGDNEVDQSRLWTIKRTVNDYDPNQNRATREVIPHVLYEFDLYRPYLPSSPYYSPEVVRQGSGDDLLPENHLWGPRGYYKDAFYNKAACSFVSEIGYHGCPNLESLKKMFDKEYLYPWTKDGEWNDEWRTKSVRSYPVLGKADNRNRLMTNQVKHVFKDVPQKLEDFIYASQSVQGEAMKYFLELWRGHKFQDKTGIIWWNLRDGWPILSDAIVDYYNSKKRAYSYLHDAGTPVCVLINDAENGGLPLVAVNDTRRPAEGSVVVTNVESGKQLFKGDFKVASNGRSIITSLPEPEGQGVLLIKYTLSGKTCQNHYLYGKPPFKLEQYRQWMKKIGK